MDDTTHARQTLEGMTQDELASTQWLNAAPQWQTRAIEDTAVYRDLVARTSAANAKLAAEF
jgi:hypothetical protein